MPPERSFSTLLSNRAGFGLITAMFVVVVLGMIGLLIARYVAISSTAATEDYLAAQALYAAESAAQLKIMCYDGGGTFGGVANCAPFNPLISSFTTTATQDDFATAANFKTLAVAAQRQEIYREIEVKYRLQ
ncbi:MAG: hypothetical protein A2521_05460 [Deltaproteobacteria bacterium RIFOXYD12_FULL_57_12]|nr:MAG: hypothetical protein A2521_05460 [Deltaproteobacteria bacterium RIFOXYD12_FULL_57_12]